MHVLSLNLQRGGGINASAYGACKKGYCGRVCLCWREVAPLWPIGTARVSLPAFTADELREGEEAGSVDPSVLGI